MVIRFTPEQIARVEESRKRRRSRSVNDVIAEIRARRRTSRPRLPKWLGGKG